MKGAAHALPLPARASRSHTAEAAGQGASSSATKWEPVGRGADPDAPSAPARPDVWRRAGGAAVAGRRAAGGRARVRVRKLDRAQAARRDLAAAGPHAD